ncbi:carboxyl transferase domain-containing protein [Thermopolyspora sp. NPDC052614]|uniref:carboxyl transferase domain-containing protein n=1 Tax=Thermopolyspora sp. NPDC052614 TaxID=3155682 RepID=UPI00342B1545
MTARADAAAFIERVFDPGSWTCWDRPVRHDTGVFSGYREVLDRARRDSGRDEAIVTGEGTINGRPVAALVGEFGFLAGSVGVGTARRVVAAVRAATARGLPLLAAPVSGGTRMQEGTAAFVQMVAVTDAVAAHRAAGLPYLVYLRHPTTGGVFASWGSLGHLTMAEPGALVGFLGPRVCRLLTGEDFPDEVQTAEHLHEHGLVDAVLPLPDLREFVHRVLDVMCRPGPDVPGAGRVPVGTPLEAEAVWEAVERTRRPDRPGAGDLLRVAATHVVPLPGSAEGEVSGPVTIALARFGDIACVVVAEDHARRDLPLGPGALRAARRGIRLAAELGLPLVTVVDTPGAELSAAAERGGLAGQIARTLHDMVTLPSPSLCVLLGEGCGGGALALLPADRVVAAPDAWLSPLPPEGASAILYRTPDRAAELARQQRIGCADLYADGIVDRVIPASPDDPDTFVHRVGAVIADELRTLILRPAAQRRRADRRVGRVHSGERGMRWPMAGMGVNLREGS